LQFNSQIEKNKNINKMKENEKNKDQNKKKIVHHQFGLKGKIKN